VCKFFNIPPNVQSDDMEIRLSCPQGQCFLLICSQPWPWSTLLLSKILFIPHSFFCTYTPKIDAADSTPTPVPKYEIIWHDMPFITTKYYLPIYVNVSQMAPFLYLPIFICEAPKRYNINLSGQLTLPISPFLYKSMSHSKVLCGNDVKIISSS